MIWLLLIIWFCSIDQLHFSRFLSASWLDRIHWEKLAAEKMQSNFIQLLCQMHSISHAVVLLHLLNKTKTTGSWSLSFFLCVRNRPCDLSCFWKCCIPSFFPFLSERWWALRLRAQRKGCAFVSCQRKRLPTLPAFWVVPHGLNQQADKMTWQIDKQTYLVVWLYLYD